VQPSETTPNTIIGVESRQLGEVAGFQHCAQAVSCVGVRRLVRIYDPLLSLRHLERADNNNHPHINDANAERVNGCSNAGTLDLVVHLGLQEGALLWTIPLGGVPLLV